MKNIILFLIKYEIHNILDALAAKIIEEKLIKKGSQHIFLPCVSVRQNSKTYIKVFFGKSKKNNEGRSNSVKEHNVCHTEISA